MTREARDSSHAHVYITVKLAVLHASTAKQSAHIAKFSDNYTLIGCTSTDYSVVKHSARHRDQTRASDKKFDVERTTLYGKDAAIERSTLHELRAIDMFAESQDAYSKNKTRLTYAE